MKILAIFIIIGSFFMVKYRERIGDMVGDPDWAGPVGGVYNLIVILAIVFFFCGVAMLTGTGDLLLKPIVEVVPGVAE